MSRPWTLLLCGYLLLWVPIGFAAELLSVLPSLGRRGLAAWSELAFHGLCAVLAATAGWMLPNGAPAAFHFARIAIVLSAVVSAQSLFWTALPRQTAPGEAVPFATIAIAHAVFWLILMQRYARRYLSTSNSQLPTPKTESLETNR